MKVAIERIEKELEERLKELKDENKLLEAQRQSNERIMI